MTCRLRWCVEMETRCKIAIWRTFERIQWHVIPEPGIILQGAATWWIHCHDSRATCHIAGCSQMTKSMSWSCDIAGCKNSIQHIENRFSPYFILFLFLMQFRFWRAAAFVSSPIHLLYAESLFIVFTFLYCFRNKSGKPQPIRTKVDIHAQVKGRQRSRNFRRDRLSGGEMGGSKVSPTPDFL